MNQLLTFHRLRRLRLPAGAALVCVLLAACEELPPRSYAHFMEDRIAREGMIALCDQNPVEMAADIECANARRAAAATALQIEREKRAELEVESQRKLEALRREMADRERAVREAALAAARAEREAYESLWREREARAQTGAAPMDESGRAALAGDDGLQDAAQPAPVGDEPSAGTGLPEPTGDPRPTRD